MFMNISMEMSCDLKKLFSIDTINIFIGEVNNRSFCAAISMLCLGHKFYHYYVFILKMLLKYSCFTMLC